MIVFESTGLNRMRMRRGTAWGPQGSTWREWASRLDICRGDARLWVRGVVGDEIA